MSEELQSKYLKNGKIIGQKIGEFEYFQIGTTTLNQLYQAGLILGNFDKKFGSHKPDRIIIDRGGLNPVVVAVVEDKKKSEFNSENKKLEAIHQCNNYCQELNSDDSPITTSKGY